MKDRIKINYEKIAIEKWIRAKEQREILIKKEITLISEKDGEARKLEQYEAEILRRLKETHVR